MSSETSKKKFHLKDLLSVFTGLCLSDKGMGSYYEILGHMTGQDITKPFVEIASGIAHPYLVKQFPQIEADLRESFPAFMGKVRAAGNNDVLKASLAKAYVAARIKNFGNEYADVESLPPGVCPRLMSFASAGDLLKAMGVQKPHDPRLN